MSVPSPVIDTAAIERFLARVRQSVQARSKDIRLAPDEAAALAAAIGQLMAANIALRQQLPAAPGALAADGGRFG